MVQEVLLCYYKTPEQRKDNHTVGKRDDFEVQFAGYKGNYTLTFDMKPQQKTKTHKDTTTKTANNF